MPPPWLKMSVNSTGGEHTRWRLTTVPIVKGLGVIDAGVDGSTRVDIVWCRLLLDSLPDSRDSFRCNTAATIARCRLPYEITQN